MESREKSDGVSSSKAVAQSLSKVFKTDFDSKYNILDIHTPQLAFMSGQYKRSHAYFTLRNHLPVVLTQVIDTLTKNKNELVAQFGEVCRSSMNLQL